MEKRILNLALVVAAGLLGIGGVLALGNPPITTAFQSPLFHASMTDKVYLPLSVNNYLPPPPPFLRAPYYGTQSMSSVFDHNLPDYVIRNNGVTPYNGITSTVLSYDGHAGYDYYSASRYEPVLAAANGQVSDARWNYPANHRSGVGLFVRIEHDNAYATLYGHLSAITVDVNTDITDAEAGRIIGLSGNTGRVSSGRGCDPSIDPTCGAHLHFDLRRNNVYVDPFGWTGNYLDPWFNRQEGPQKSNATSHNVWLEYPAISNTGIYTSGAARVRPTPPSNAGSIIVDDGDADYTQTSGCWTTASPVTAYGGDLRYTVRLTTTANCSAQWSLPAYADASGDYHVYAHIISYTLALPQGYVSTQGGIYTIRHAGQDDYAILNQWAFTNTGHTSPWVYLGTYSFTRSGNEYVSVSNQTYDHDVRRYVLADAIRFVPLNPPQPTAGPTHTPTRTPTPHPTRSPTPTPTPAHTDTYEPNNTFDTAHRIFRERWYYSYIWTPTDYDYYKFYVEAYPSAYVYASLQSIPPGTDYDLRLYSPTGALLASSTNSGNTDEYFRKWVDQSGDYRVLVCSHSGLHQNDTYQLKFSQGTAPTALTETVLAIGGTARTDQGATFFSALPTPTTSLDLLSLSSSRMGVATGTRGSEPGFRRCTAACIFLLLRLWLQGARPAHIPQQVLPVGADQLRVVGYVSLADSSNGQVIHLSGALEQESIFLNWMRRGQP